MERLEKPRRPGAENAGRAYLRETGDGLRDFRVYHDRDLREIDGGIIPPVRDRVLARGEIRL